MKNHQLTNFQKEQYTQYLQAQLEKFSAFMLSQKKQNQTYKTMQIAIDKQNKHIDNLSQKIKILQTYQRQNYRQCQRIEGSTARTIDIEQRLKKVQSVYFENMNSGNQNMVKYSPCVQKNLIHEEIIELGQQFYAFKQQIQIKIKRLQKQIKSIIILPHQQKINRRNQQINTNHSDVFSCNSANFPTQVLATKKQLRSTQQNFYEFFNKKINKIQKMVKKSVNSTHSSKPSYAPSTMATQKVTTNQINQEQTFGFNSGEYDEYNIGNINNSLTNLPHDKSYSVSQASVRLQPVQYFSHTSIQKQAQKRKGNRKTKSKLKYQKGLNNKRSASKSLSKSKSKSIQNSKSITHSRSKSNKKSKDTYTKAKEHSKKSVSPSQKHQHGTLQYVNQYKKMCKKKHF